MEIILVLGVITILVAIVIAAINPSKQLDDAKGADRHLSVREIENAIVQYIIDGNTFSGIPSGKSNAIDICRSSVKDASCTGGPVNGYDLSSLTGSYLTDIPIDPSETDESITGYRIYLLGSFTKVCSVREESDCGS